MKIHLDKNILTLIFDDKEVQSLEFKHWFNEHKGNCFIVKGYENKSVTFENLGRVRDIKNEPINISSHSTGELKFISNFAHTPFELDGQEYASVESFWQSLKFSEIPKRIEIAKLFGKAAKNAGSKGDNKDTFTYKNKTIRIGTHEHWNLMKRACIAKFTQCDNAKTALLNTGKRQLMHITRQESITIPNSIMAEIWMKIRYILRKHDNFDRLTTVHKAEQFLLTQTPE